MNHLVFVIWVIGFGLLIETGQLLIAKSRQIMGLTQLTASQCKLFNLFYFTVWVWIAVLLWQGGS